MQLRVTKAVKFLLIAIISAFLVQQTVDQFFGGNLLNIFALVPSGFVLEHRFWQLITYSFLHGDVMHLFLNMMMLLFIGSEIEVAWGTPRFLRYYFVCSISAGAIYLLLQLLILKGTGLHVPMVGASGAIYGLLVAYGIMFSERVLLFMMLFPMKAKHFVWILAAIEFMSTVFSARGGLASAAHLGGMLAGFLYLWIYAAIAVARRNRTQSGGRRKQKPKKRKTGEHLRLVINNERDPDLDASSDDDLDDNPKTWH